jgi:hydrogenase maturation protein HypF
MKGLGGFHLVCDATNPEAVSLLRTRKKRNEKPFAVMFINIPHVRSYADLDDDAEQLLKGPRRPIVLLPSKENLPSEIAPGISFVGVMLPYTPLHHLLMKRCDKPLVMTSGNFSDEPICMENAEALERLSAIADAFLLHNRRIETRFDDSVVKHDRGCNILIRRSRGYAPQPVSLPGTIDGCVLAVGAELKNTFCLAKDKHAFLSQHIGDLDDVSAYEFFQNTLEKFGHLFDLEATVIAHDLHPDYMSTRIASEIAKRKSIPSYGVQHHHAHIVGCMADNGITERVIGVALDGTGYGDDGTIWGVEFLIADYVGYERFAKFAPVKMPGAEAAVRQPARMLASYEKGHPFIRERLQRLFNQKEASAVRSQLEHDLNCCWTSSCGRLFDAVSALLGICPKPSFEGQAAMMLECVAQKGARTQFEYKAEAEGLVDGYAIIGLLADLLQRGTDEADVAFAFHEILASEISRICLAAAMRERIQTVCLSGGCFQNSLLLSLTMEKLKAVGLNVVIPNRIPPNDGGISLGQSLVAAAAAGKWSTI